ncbi:LysR family transcriptional regulator [Aquimarina agarivorans]|uniref:LysR family transcriptional regulator n=1 Tax=Aquimarina agarivorans TaxID=980584 RepID=UPI000248F30C|nr:LysR family transcriptional regulator [Aquimarina agarivorans]
MNLQFVKYFITLSNIKNFTKAAEEVNVVQSTFSSGIKKLEDHLGVRLFERSKRNVKLTHAGVQFLPKANELIYQWQEIEANFNLRLDNELHIGFSKNIASNDILNHIKHFKKDNVDTKINLLEKKHELLSELLERDELHVFFTDREIQNENFDKMIVATEKLFFAIPEGHYLASKASISLDSMKKEPFIQREHCLLYNQVYSELNKRKINPQIVFSADNNEIVSALVSFGMGITLMPLPVFDIPKIKFIPIKETSFSLNLYLVWKKNNRHKALNNFIEIIGAKVF